MENNITQVVALGTSLGRSQALGLIAFKSSLEQAKAFQQLWESGSYKLLGLTWEQYCLDYAGLSHQRVETIIRNRQEFGDIYLLLSDIIAVSPETYRHIQPKVHDDCLEISGVMVPILPENAARIREAVHRLRADLRKAQEDVELRSGSNCARAATLSLPPNSPACKPASKPGSTTSAAWRPASPPATKMLRSAASPSTPSSTSRRSPRPSPP